MTFSSIQEQYEKYPYPPVGRFALPLRQQGTELSYEVGTRFALGLSLCGKSMKFSV